MPESRTSPPLLSVSTACAERLILRNHSPDDQPYELTTPGQVITGIAERRPAGVGSVYAATMIRLPSGGVTGRLTGRNIAFAIDTRGAPPCVRPLSDSVVGRPSDDYMVANAPGQQVIRGVVSVDFKPTSPRPAIDSLIAHLGASQIGMSLFEGTTSSAPYAGRTYYFWFDGDDDVGTVGVRQSLAFLSSGLARSASGIIRIPGPRPEPVPPTSIEAFSPCVERLIVRNSGVEDRSLRLQLADGASRVFVARGRNALSSQVQASTIIDLSDGERIDRLYFGSAAVDLKSRDSRSCIAPMPDSMPGTPLTDYLVMNSAALQVSGPGRFPGVVRVLWKQPLQRALANSLIRSTRASLIGAQVIDAQRGIAIYYYWFGGDDSSANVARRRAEEFNRSPAVEAASTEDLGRNMTP